MPVWMTIVIGIVAALGVSFIGGRRRVKRSPDAARRHTGPGADRSGACPSPHTRARGATLRASPIDEEGGPSCRQRPGSIAWCAAPRCCAESCAVSAAAADPWSAHPRDRRSRPGRPPRARRV